jgi:hypothetical protein
MSIWIEGLPNPFALREPSAAWLSALERYDADLRVYVSQKHRTYRLARLARHSGPMNGKLFGAIPGLHPDTRVCLQRGLVPVTTIPPPAIDAPAELVVAQLRRRDTWHVHGGDIEKIADSLEHRDTLREAAVDAGIREELRSRARAMRTGYLYRTGARVALSKRPEGDVTNGTEHPATPGTPE